VCQIGTIFCWGKAFICCAIYILCCLQAALIFCMLFLKLKFVSKISWFPIWWGWERFMRIGRLQIINCKRIWRTLFLTS
jgi:hypothetical protein